MKKTKLIGIAAALVAAISLNFVSCNNDTTTEEEATSIGVTGIVSGVVYDSQTKQGIEGVTVTIGSHSAETNSSGVYVIKNVEPTEENDLTGYSVVMHKDNYLDTVATATVVVKPKEYTSVDPYAESTLTKEWIGALKATNKNETNGTSTSASGSETTNVNITYSNDVVNVAMEKISYAYGISVASVEMVPLTSGITGTVYLDDIKNDSIEGTTVAKKAIVSFVYDKDGNIATTDDEYVFKENAKTNDDGVFEYYGLPTGVLSSTVFYKVDYTDETTKNYYTTNGTLENLNKNDTLIVNEKDDTAKYFQAGKVNAVLTDIIKVTKDNFNGKVLNVTDSIVLTFDHQLSKLEATVDDITAKVDLDNTIANICTATISPVTTFPAGSKNLKLTSILATNGTDKTLYSPSTDYVEVNFVEFKFVGMSVVDASRAAVTSSQYLELEFNMDVGSVKDCTVGGKVVDPIISGVYVDVPFNDTVNTASVNVVIGTITAKAADSLTTSFDSSTYNTASYYSEQSNYIASTNLAYNSSSKKNELAFGLNLELTFAADLGTYTDIKLSSTDYVASYDATSKKMTISNVSKEPFTVGIMSTTINVMNGTTTVYSTSNKNFAQKASEAAVAGTNNISFSVVKPSVTTYTTATEFNKTINTPIALTFDRAVTGYKALLLKAYDDSSNYDDVEKDTIIASTSALSTDGKSLTVTPSGLYAYDIINNAKVIVQYYTANGDYVGYKEYSFKDADGMTQEKYFAALTATANTIKINKAISTKYATGVTDECTASFDFVPEYNYPTSKSDSSIKYTLYTRTKSVKGVYSTWSNGESIIASESNVLGASCKVNKTVSFSATTMSIQYMLYKVTDNQAKVYTFDAISDTKAAILTSGTTIVNEKVTLAGNNPSAGSNPTYSFTASESLKSVTVAKTFATATAATVAIDDSFATGTNSFTVDLTKGTDTDSYTSADYITLTMTDLAGNVSTVNVYFN